MQKDSQKLMSIKLQKSFWVLKFFSLNLQTNNKFFSKIANQKSNQPKMYTTNRVIIFLALLIGFILSACSYDDIVMDIVQEQKDVQRTQYIQTSYEKAYAKMLALYPSTFATGKRMSAGMPIVDNSYPLWYSDTALVTPDPNPFGPDQPESGDEDVPTAANDSIYAYVFDFANEQGSMVVSVDENLPDLLAYSKGRNFLKNPYINILQSLMPMHGKHI